MRPLILAIIVWTFGVIACAAASPPGIDKIAPMLQQLGAGWTSNQVAVLLDPLSSPSDVSVSQGWRQSARNLVGKNGYAAHAALRYYYGTNCVFLWIDRFKSPQDVRPDWGTDSAANQGRPGLDRLPAVGEEVRFYHRHGLHNNIAFRRGLYLIDVEGIGAPLEKLKELAEVVDKNLVKALGL